MDQEEFYEISVFCIPYGRCSTDAYAELSPIEALSAMLCFDSKNTRFVSYKSLEEIYGIK